ncbi:hypothetical protein [Leptolyngbya sp. 7M]|uniref:hypothetical protein n=1 Tax=Leptolyngbya sp. 7M TaxID=2812896 RepID=UPI001B8BA849|nr:hypothetical protein [Leptolyngbya sp. 7M]QYO65082.1 hypothetical protein JVX88_37195 [Leptolyngbya sp. 7M]
MTFPRWGGLRSGRHDKNALQEAAEFLQDKWNAVQQSLSRTEQRLKQAVDSAWTRLTKPRA